MWLAEISLCKKVKNAVLCIYVIKDLNGEEVVGTFYEKKKKKKANQIEFRIEIVIKEKCDEHNFQWRRYGYSFRNWVDE